MKIIEDNLKVVCKKMKLLFLLILSLAILPLYANAVVWPQEIEAKEGTIIVYQPQPEALTGNILTGRAAMSIEAKSQKDPVFGVFWFEAKINTDKDNDKAHIASFVVTKVRWPDSKDAQEQRFSQIVNNAIPKAGFDISFSQLSASLANAEQEEKSLLALKNDPPKIIFKKNLAVLLLFDGEPKFTKIENTTYERAVNTPFLVIKDTKKSDVYLSNGDDWFTAKSALGPWSFTTTVPNEMVRVLPKKKDGTAFSSTSKNQSTTEIVVATEPTEVIVSQGKPNWTSLSVEDLLYVENTETPWLRDIPTNNMYILISGRWFRSMQEAGPWTFVKANELPPSFQEIPPDSDIGGIRTSVAGTPEAEEAVLDAQVPQTAAIKRSEAKLTVEYDGEPKFKKISGTEVSYATNTTSQVLLINNKYYAVDNAVWFVSDTAKGPWVVADDIPDEQIAQIPPEAPVYNTTYVQVYDSTPDVVYVGYRPGYLWSFTYYGVPVYGTGWYYPPYVYGPVYYPYPVTWGYHVGYNPWYGWGYGATWGAAFFTAGVIWARHNYWHGHGWYGGRWGRDVDIDIDRDINVGDINIGNNRNSGSREKFSNKLNERRGNNGNSFKKDNLYNRDGNASRLAKNDKISSRFQKAKPSNNRKNNVFSDRQGNVVRKTNSGWQTRENKTWKNDKSLNSNRTTSNKTLSNRTTNNRASSTTKNRNYSPGYTANSKKTLSSSRNRNYTSRSNRSRSQRLNGAHTARQRGISRSRSGGFSRSRGGGRRR